MLHARAQMGLIPSVAAIALLAGGCTVAVTDAQVFNKPATEPPPTTIAGLKVDNEDTLPPDVRITHGFTETPVGKVAYTHARSTAPGSFKRPVALLCMGNGANRKKDAVNYIDDLIPYADVVTFDYPGYGDSEGEPKVAALEAAIGSMIDTLPRIGVSESRTLFAWGHSLGGFVCGQVAGRDDRIEAIGLLATLDSTQSVAKAFTPRLAGPFVRYDIQDGLETYDTVASLNGFEGPVMVVIPGNDQLFPPARQRAMAQKLTDQGNEVEVFTLPGSGHSHFDDNPEFPVAITRFMARLDALE